VGDATAVTLEPPPAAAAALAAAAASSLFRTARGCTVLDRKVLVKAKMEGNTLDTGIMTAALMKPATKVWPVLPGSVP